MSDIPPKEIRTLDVTTEQMFKILKDKLTIIDSDAQDDRKQVFQALFNQISLLTEGKKQAEEKLKKSEEMNRILTKKLTELGVIEPETKSS